jgi:Reverse transcriptase (RNA-dependent DNA polymerase)
MIAAQRNLRHHPESLVNYIKSNRLTAEFKRTSKEAKLTHWKKFCSSISSQTSLSTIWKMVKRLKYNLEPAVNPALSNKDLQMLFLDRIAPTNQPAATPLDWQSLEGTSMKPDHPFHEADITKPEIDLALETVNAEATPGPDNISYGMLTHLPDQHKDALRNLFNSIWQTGYCPEDWKKAWLKPILKSGQRPNEEQSYRPILYTSCVSKLFETILKKRLVAFIEQNKLLPQSQHGFRQGMNIQMCLADLISAINLSFSKKQMHFVLMADIKGAFDNVPHTALLEELHFAGLPPKFINWLDNFLKGRTLWFFTTTGDKHSRPLGKGVPQGGVLSPLLYILYVRSLEHHIRRILRIIQFADDTLIHFCHHNMQISRSILREAIEALYYFFKHGGWT